MLKQTNNNMIARVKRMLAILALGVLFPAVALADTYTYYIDCRNMDRSSTFQINWIQKVKDSTPLSHVKDSPESGVITVTTDFAIGDTDETMIKFDISFTGANSQIQHIGSSCMSTNNCIKIKGAGSFDYSGGDCSGFSSYVEFTNYADESFTVNSSVSANGSISPNGEHGVSTSQTYTVSLDAGYKVSDVTNTTGGTLDPTAEELLGRYGSFTVTLSSPTSDGDLTITTTTRTSYSVTVTAEGGEVSPAEAQTIYQGDSKNFTVTPYSGLVYKRYNTGSDFAGTVSKSDNTFTVTPTHGGTVTLIYGTPGSDLPVVRIGEKIYQELDNDVVTSAYLTSEKCIDVDEIVVYYANNSAFRTEGSMITKTKSFTSGSPYALKTTHSLTLTASEVSAIVEDGETLYVRMKAHNSNGYSAYSDIVSLVYANKNFVAVNQEKLDADACDGNHEFTWSDMFTPVPAFDDCSVVDASGNNVKDQFALTSDGKMVWNVIKSSSDGKITIKDNGTYVFTFTAKKKGYTPADATFTVTLTTTSTDDEISGICVYPGSSPVTEYGDLTPWKSASLTATKSSSEIDKIGWTVSPVSDNYILTPIEGSPVKFKAKAAGEYTVTARGLTLTCGSSAYKTLKLIVNKDSEPCD